MNSIFNPKSLGTKDKFIVSKHTLNYYCNFGCVRQSHQKYDQVLYSVFEAILNNIDCHLKKIGKPVLNTGVETKL